MKNFLLNPLFVFLLISVVFVSCSDDAKDPGPAGDITAPVGKLVATIGSTSFEGIGGAQVANDEIIIGGISGDQSISIFITKAAEVGTYEVKGTTVGVTPDAEVNYSPDGATLASSIFAENGTKVGTVTITEIDENAKTMSGTFSSAVVFGDGTSLDLTAGSFNKIPYTTQSASSLSAKVDGQDFTASVAIGQTSMGMIVLNGQAVNGSKIITLSFPDDIEPGTYEMGELGLSDSYATYTVNMESFVTGTGTLTITSHNTSTKRIEGTFSFHAESFFEEGTSHEITQGTFAVTYN